MQLLLFVHANTSGQTKKDMSKCIDLSPLAFYSVRCLPLLRLYVALGPVLTEEDQRNPSYPSVYVLKRYLNLLQPVKSSIYAFNFAYVKLLSNPSRIKVKYIHENCI